MSLPYGIKAIHPSSASSKPHVLGFTTARSAANDTLVEVWNAATNAGIKAAVDLDGKFYSAAATAGDVPYAVTGGVSNVRRYDTLAIGAAGKVMRSDGSAPTWTTLTIPDTCTSGDVLYASAANTLSSLAKGTTSQVLHMDATGSFPEWTSSPGGLSTVTATSFVGGLIGNVVGNLTGTVLTAAQPNITSLGTLTGITLSGEMAITTNTDVAISFAGSPTNNVHELAAATSDGSDDQGVRICGGGGSVFSRGANVVAYGNEHASNPGRISLITGSEATSGLGIVLSTSGANVRVSGGPLEIDDDLDHDGSNVGFYGTAPVAQQTGVAVSDAAIHAALVNLGLITA